MLQRAHFKDRSGSMTCLIVTSLLLISAPSAYANYTVIDDDLYPNSIIEARVKTSAQPAQDHYTVPFTKDRSPLNVASRAVLDTLIPKMMRNEAIHVIGRPDATVYTTGKMGAIARNRAVNIRDYLISQGVSAGRITIQTDSSSNQQLNDNSYPCDIYITNTDSRTLTPLIANSFNDVKPEIYQSERYAAARAYVTSTQPVFTVPLYAPVTPVVVANPVPQPRDRQLIQFINQAVQNGQMHVTVALKLLRGLIETEYNYVSQQAATQITMPQLRAPESAPAPQFVATPALIRNESWLLDRKLTLRDNLNAWLKTAGWNPAVWEASNLYEITATSTFEGGFPDILRKVADATGLNICAKTREKIVRVTDATVSCK